MTAGSSYRLGMRLLLLVLLSGCAPSEAQLEEIRALFAKTDAGRAPLDAAFTAAVMKRPTPEDKGRCPAAFALEDLGQFTRRLTMWLVVPNTSNGVQASNVTIITGKTSLEGL